MLQRFVVDKFLRTLDQINYGSVMIQMPDGKRHHFSGKHPGAHGTFYIDDLRTISAMLANADIGLVEAYRDGWWRTDHLPNLFIFGLQNEEALHRYLNQNFFARLSSRLSYSLRQNTIRGSRKNIHAHYDLGNRFYSLWLDPSMTYSSALFHKEESLEQAQYNKYDRIIERCDMSSGRVLEIGCGWGGFADRALQKHDYALKGLTISEDQFSYAQERLGARAEILMQDYRQHEGLYDRIVSIEMFEAVGEKYWPAYFQKIRSLLKEGGCAIIQTITLAEKYFEDHRKTGDMLRTFIFPGGMLASFSRFKEEAEKAGLRITDSCAFGKSYVRTLNHWLENFESKLPEIQNMGFDKKFIRIWRAYLAGCIASFTVDRLNVVQLELRPK